MGILKTLIRGVVLVLSVVMVGVGGLGLGIAYAPEHALIEKAIGAAETGVEVLESRLPIELPEEAAASALTAISGFPLRFALAPFGLVVLIATLLSGSNRREVDGDAEEDTGHVAVDRRTEKKSRKQAAGLHRQGMTLEAAELCFAVGLMDEAAKYFLKAEEYVRAAEIRHEQERFIECAELYARGGSHDAAGAIYAQHGEFGRAADAYAQGGSMSVAAETYEKAGNQLRAAECFEACEFLRHAAQAYTRCEQWERAAKCMEQVLIDEAPVGGGSDPAREADYEKMLRMTGHLWERADRLDKAESVFEKGGQYAFAAEIAAKRGEAERAAELYLRAKDVVRAAKALERLGKHERAAHIMAEYHRDRGEEQEAAEKFEEAGELLEAGDLYRLLERYPEAGECYERFGDGGQAAEMFHQAADYARAAQNYERAGRFKEAAECCSNLGDSEREAELFEKSGSCLQAGQLFRSNGRNEEAIKALQKVGPEDADFLLAAAIIGEIFREREMYPLAIAKLTEAIGEREVNRDSLPVFYCLATVYEANGDNAEANELYQKILACDVGYADAEERLNRTRELLSAKAEAEVASRASSGGPPAATGQPSRYIIRGTLGRGGMGIVYEAEDTVLDRKVAFKVLPEALKENPQALKNFLREAKSAAQLNHPNIVTVYDAGEQDGVFYIAMEYVDGKTLKEIIKKKGMIAPKAAIHVLAQLAEALAYAHEKKIVHRDIKTANAMWTVDRKAKIMDFGLAKVIEEVRNHTTVVSGTPYYMSPEQTLGKNVDHRTDIYSFGVSAFEMATGKLPFTEGNLPYHHLHTPPPSPLEFNADLPDMLVQMIAKCMKKDPNDRYQTAGEILEELRTGL